MLSICLATYNEEENIGECLQTVRNLADEIVVVDGGSKDKTVEIAQKFGAKVIVTDNPPMFHINKQKALRQAQGEWILQLDADERVSPELSEEIKKVIKMNDQEIEKYQESLPERKLFLRHQKLSMKHVTCNIKHNKQNPQIASCFTLHATCYSAFYIPRKNFFLGKFLRYGGVYPDGVIRLVKKGKARFPAKDVHELMEVDGKTGWLQNPLLHYDSPTFKRYLERNNRYINLMVDEMRANNYPKNIAILLYCYIVKPIHWFLMTTIRHKGILDGWRGIVFSFFSSLRFPRAYWRYIRQI